MGLAITSQPSIVVRSMGARRVMRGGSKGISLPFITGKKRSFDGLSQGSARPWGDARSRPGGDRDEDGSVPERKVNRKESNECRVYIQGLLHICKEC